MNNILNINRLCKVISYDLKNNFSKVYITLLALAAAPIITIIFTFLLNDNAHISPSLRLTEIVLFTTLAIFITPFIAYKHVNNKKGGIDFIMMPASSFEKFLSMVFITIIVAPVFTFIASIAFDTLYTIIFGKLNILFGGIYDKFIFNGSTLWKDLLVNSWKVLLFGCVGLAGNMVFKKNKAIKTIGISFIFIFIISLIFTTISVRIIKNAEVMDIDGNKVKLEDLSGKFKIDKGLSIGTAADNLDSASINSSTDSSTIVIKTTSNNRVEINASDKTTTVTTEGDIVTVKRDGKVFKFNDKSMSSDLINYMNEYLEWIKVLIIIFSYVIVPGGLYTLTYLRIRKEQL